MTIKTPVIGALLVVVFAGTVFTHLFGSEVDSVTPKKNETTTLPGDSVASIDSTESEATPELLHKVVAYYFHGTRRCYSCKKIEAYSVEAIEEGFKEQLASGELEFHSVNVDEDQNRHYTKDYQLYTKSLVVSKLEKGKETEWKNLTKVWQLYRNKEKFIQYMQDEIKAYLEES